MTAVVNISYSEMQTSDLHSFGVLKGPCTYMTAATNSYFHYKLIF